MEKKIRSKVITREEAVEIGEEYRKPEVELLRSMIFEEGKRAIRRRVLENLPARTLDKSLKLKKVETKLRHTRLFMEQFKILNPKRPLKVDPRKIDITLWLTLARVFSSGGFSNDEFEEAANKLRDLRNAITHIGDITKFEMDASWNEAEDLLLKLGATSRSIDKYKDQRRQALDLYTPDDSQSMHVYELKTDVDQGSVKFMTRAGWKANKPTGKRDLIVDRMPVNYLIVSQIICSRASGRDGDICQVISNIQRFHMKNKGWFDIAYNFLVGDDGVIYEGRGWDFQGATAFGWGTGCSISWNEKSFGVCFVGPKTRPSRKAERAFLTFINYLVSVNKLSEDSIVHGLSQVRPAIHNMPAERFYRRMRDWPIWKICPT